MTYAAKLTAGLSQDAREALVNAGTSRQGTTIPRTVAGAVRGELRDRGLIGPLDGLTQSGTIARDHIQESDLAEMF